MILQALYEYYERKGASAGGGTPQGFEWKEVPFIVEVNPDGGLVQIENTKEIGRRRQSARKFLVPQAVSRTSTKVSANLLWDNLEYVLGLPGSKKLEEQGTAQKRARYHQQLSEKRDAFIKRIKLLPPETQDDRGVHAVLKFLEGKPVEALKKSQEWKELDGSNANVAFRLQGDNELVCRRPAIRSFIDFQRTQHERDGTCLITGTPDHIARLHPPIKGVMGGQTSGAHIVSFNLPAFWSYGKKQGYTAPIGDLAAGAYTKALNMLLASTQRAQIADASIVFWAERDHSLESKIVNIFGELVEDNPERVQAVKSLYDSPRTGVYVTDSDPTRFYVLGLAPNAARLAVRLWHVSTVAELAKNIRMHFDDLGIARSSFEPPYLSLKRLLVSTAALREPKNIPSSLGGDMMRSI